MAASDATAPGSHRRWATVADQLLGAFTETQLRLGLAAHSILWGAGYLAGPASLASSSSFDVIRLVPVSLRVWGALFLVVGVLLAFRRWSCTAHSVAAVLWFVWAVGLLLALPYGSLVAWGGWLHVLVVSAAHRHLSGVGR